MDPNAVEAIDVHGHYGTPICPTKSDLLNSFSEGNGNLVVERARKARTAYTIVSPLLGLMPRGNADPVRGNEDSQRVVQECEGLLRWVIVDPGQPATYEQAAEMLSDPKCAGIKIHPEEHLYPIRDYGREIFEFAERHKTVILSHSGDPNSLPADLVVFANEFPGVRLILGHIGCGHDGDPTHQVRAIQQSKHGNVYADTSSAKSILPRLIEWTVGQVGPERVLYGTDTPLYFAPCQRARIDSADLSDTDKRLILRDNAIRLFQLDTMFDLDRTKT